MSSLILYGVPFSQPVRAVMWLLLLKRQNFELILTNPGSKGDNGSRHPDYLRKNPAGTIPCIEEPDTGFTLGEAHAIMTYLADVHGWHDVFPKDHRVRGRINAYLHYHHKSLRDASTGLVAPKVRKDLNIPEAVQTAAHHNLGNALSVLEQYFLAEQDYLCGDFVTLADLAAYVEIGQLQPEFTNLMDFSGFPKVKRWLELMHGVDGHDEVHVVLREMGDISLEAPTMDRIRAANIAALKALKARLQSF